MGNGHLFEAAGLDERCTSCPSSRCATISPVGSGLRINSMAEITVRGVNEDVLACLEA